MGTPMNQLYVAALSLPYEGGYVLGVYSSEALAHAAIDELIQTGKWFGHAERRVTPFTIDAPADVDQLSV